MHELEYAAIQEIMCDNSLSEVNLIMQELIKRRHNCEKKKQPSRSELAKREKFNLRFISLQKKLKI